MPARLDRCVKRVKKTIKPRKKGQNKGSAANAVCVKATGHKKKKSGGWTKGKKKK